MRFLAASLAALAGLVGISTACDSCYGPSHDVEMVRNVRRAQPESLGAVTKPKGPLEWGQLNGVVQTDTHGWLEGHLKEQNYGADWGDFVAFTAHMKARAEALDVDLLLVDTGDLHDGAGLSDATSPNGNISNVIFENIDYDLLTIGNHELYVSEITYETFNQFSKQYGERYLTSNVQIVNPATGALEYIGQKYRHFTTAHGLRIMAFGVLFDFTGNSNASKVTRAADLVQEAWFQAQIARADIDLFVLVGHNPVRQTSSSSSWAPVYSAIRNATADTPILIFGGHTHIRDFAVYDDRTVALESGRYCETLGWLSMNGLAASNATAEPAEQPTPSRAAVKTAAASSKSASKTASAATASASAAVPAGSARNLTTGLSGCGNATTASPYRYARRYLDWNRLTLEYHTQTTGRTFNTTAGSGVTAAITADRHALNLTTVLGCAPQAYCISCAPQTSSASIFPLLQTALAATVVNASRAHVPRIVIINTGSVRFDLPQGPFTRDDSYIVSPFADGFQFVADVPYAVASQMLAQLNAGPYQKKKKRALAAAAAPGALPRRGAASMPSLFGQAEDCVNPDRDTRLSKRSVATTDGYVTTDDFGTDGDDTPHIAVPYYAVTNDIQANASFPADGSLPAAVDFIFLDFIVEDVLSDLAALGANYTAQDVSYYMPRDFTTNTYLSAYVQQAWTANMDDCPTM